MNSVWCRPTLKSVPREGPEVPCAGKGGFCWVCSGYGRVCGSLFDKGVDERVVTNWSHRSGSDCSPYDSKGKQQGCLFFLVKMLEIWARKYDDLAQSTETFFLRFMQLFILPCCSMAFLSRMPQDAFLIIKGHMHLPALLAKGDATGKDCKMFWTITCSASFFEPPCRSRCSSSLTKVFEVCPCQENVIL